MNKNTEKGKTVAAAVALVITVTAMCVGLVILQSNSAKAEKADRYVSVGVVGCDGITVSEDNPASVRVGESVGFHYTLEDGYVIKSVEGAVIRNGMLVIDKVSSGTSIIVSTGRIKNLTVESAEHGSVVASDSGELAEGSAVTVTLIPDEHYTVGMATLNGDAIEVSDNTATFTLSENSVFACVFIPEALDFMVRSSSETLGKASVSDSRDIYRYSETVTLSASCSVGYAVFTGWSTGVAVSDGGTVFSTDSTVVFTLEESATVFANFADGGGERPLVYDANGGEWTEQPSDTGYTPYAVVNLPAYRGEAVRDGYTPVGFCENPDGNGRVYSFGASFVMPRYAVRLYIVWEKQCDISLFRFEKSNGSAILTGFADGVGKSDIPDVITVPDMYDSLPVTTIAKDAFASCDASRIVLNVSMKTVSDGAFTNCRRLKTVTMFENVDFIRNAAFTGCDEFTTLRVNATLARVFDRQFDCAMADKYMRLVTSDADIKPRIILVGGSGRAFSINSELIAKEYPDYTVINFGTSIYYGILPSLDILRDHVREGDIVILSPEYTSSMYGNTQTSAMQNWNYLESNFDILLDIDMSETTCIIGTYNSYKKSKLSYLASEDGYMKPRTYYKRSLFNEYGDLAKRHESLGISVYTALPKLSLVSATKMETVNRYAGYFAEKGAKCCFSFAPSCKGDISDSELRETCDAVSAALRSALSDDCTLISDPYDYMYTSGDFFDTNYHLSSDSAVINTQRLIADLKAYLSSK